MKSEADLRAYADWYRAIARSDRRNRLDELADEMDVLRAAVEVKRIEHNKLVERAAHEARIRATIGGTPDEIAAAVRALRIHSRIE